ncbi:MAG: hypothetical protein V3V78_02795 [Candidatus Woesearchaeota archaeon]
MKKTKLKTKVSTILRGLTALKSVFVVLVALLVIASPSVSAVVSHPAEQVVAGNFGATHTGNWSFTNGNVGIGTLFPSVDLHVVDTVRVSGLVSCDTIDTDMWGVLSCGSDDYAANTNAGTICAAGQFLNGDTTCDAGYLDADGSDAVNDAVYSEATIQSVCTLCIGDAQIVQGSIDASEIATSGVATAEILDNTINAIDLEATNTEANNDIVTYDSGTGGFTFNSCSEITGSSTLCDGSDANSGGDITGVVESGSTPLTFSACSSGSCSIGMNVDASGDCATGYACGGGHTHTVACPGGFTSIIDAGTGRQLGCMQNIERDAGTWWSATDFCFDTYGGRLPSSGEWYSAMNNFAFTGETGNWEWVDDYATAGTHGVIGASSLTGMSQSNGAYTYRCFIPN